MVLANDCPQGVGTLFRNIFGSWYGWNDAVANYQHPVSNFIATWSEQGAVSGLCYLAAHLVILSTSVAIFRRTGSTVSLLTANLALVLLVDGGFSYLHESACLNVVYGTLFLLWICCIWAYLRSLSASDGGHVLVVAASAAILSIAILLSTLPLARRFSVEVPIKATLERRGETVLIVGKPRFGNVRQTILFLPDEDVDVTTANHFITGPLILQGAAVVYPMTVGGRQQSARATLDEFPLLLRSAARLSGQPVTSVISTGRIGAMLAGAIRTYPQVRLYVVMDGAWRPVVRPKASGGGPPEHDQLRYILIRTGMGLYDVTEFDRSAGDALSANPRQIATFNPKADFAKGLAGCYKSIAGYLLAVYRPIPSGLTPDSNRTAKVLGL
jgi:hypothetical protein